MSYKIAKEYSESMDEAVSSMEKSLDMTIPEFQKSLETEIDSFQDAANEFVDEAQDGLSAYISNSFSDSKKDTKIKDILLPGSNSKVLTEEDVQPVVETDYENDGDLTKFLSWLNSQYPANIPKHDGSSVLACEKASSFLEDLSRRIFKSIKLDVNDDLDVSALENINNKIFADVKHLKRKIKESALNEDDEIVKVARTPNNVVISVTPFTRAICGILINSCVSAGKPFEEVYDYLKAKYEIKPREELEILQTLMDYGQPIFKDRGSMPIPDSISDKKDVEEKESALGGVDFVRSYFA